MSQAGKGSKEKWYKSWIMKELYRAAAIVLGIVFISSILLKVITRHNQELSVPDLSGMSIDEAKKVARQSKMKIEVTDSIFMPKLPRGTVFRQIPHPGSMVKKNRRILLTINSIEAKKVSMPSVVGYSLRQAKAELSIRNLKVGKLIYVSDMATNNVLAQLLNGRYIDAGTMIDAESEIDLQVGISSDMETTFIPNVLGQTLITAKDLIIDNSLNIGSLFYDQTIINSSDSLTAIIYKQSPEASDFSSFHLGSRVDLYFTLDKSKIIVKND